MDTGFLGRDGFIWAIGVVEDRHDPDKLGRVKVRWLGYHTREQQKIKTADLPWAEVMQPVGSNAMAGIGDSPIGIVEGTWVVGFFRDPGFLQEPIVMGTLPGKNTHPAERMNDLGMFRGDLKDYDGDGDKDGFEFGFYDPTSSYDDVPFEADINTYVPGKTSGAGKVTKVDVSSDETSLRIHSYIEHNKPAMSDLSETATATIGTHSQGLYDTFGTTRRLTAEDATGAGKSYATGSITSDASGDREETPTGDAAANKASKVISTGYLEDSSTRGSDGAYWPLTNDLISDSRMPYPRLEKISVTSLTTKQEADVQALFDAEVYGKKKMPTTGTVVLPRADTNRLAQGGYKITGISAAGVITVDKGKQPKPSDILAKGDKIQISGVVGMEPLNGQTLALKSAAAAAVTITLPSTVSGMTYVRGGVVLLDPHSVLANKADTRERWINISGADLDDGKYAGYWNQPTSRYAAEYPYNHVYESESGHIKEFDDTPGAERIHEYHRSGTFYEIDADGHKVDYVKGDNYNIRVHDDYLYVKGHVVWTGDNDMLIASNEKMSLSSKWRLKVSSGGDIEVYSKRNINFRAEGDINMLAGGNINLEAEVTTDAHDNYIYPAGSRAKETISNINLLSGTVTTKAGDGDISLYTVKGDISIATDNPDPGGHISAYSAKGQIRVKAPDDDITLYSSTGEIDEKASKIYMNSSVTTTPDTPDIPEVALLAISQNADSVSTGTSGQGSGLGINSTSGDNIRKLRK